MFFIDIKICTKSLYQLIFHQAYHHQWCNRRGCVSRKKVAHWRFNGKSWTCGGVSVTRATRRAIFNHGRYWRARVKYSNLFGLNDRPLPCARFGPGGMRGEGVGWGVAAVARWQLRVDLVGGRGLKRRRARKKGRSEAAHVAKWRPSFATTATDGSTCSDEPSALNPRDRIGRYETSLLHT